MSFHEEAILDEGGPKLLIKREDAINTVYTVFMIFGWFSMNIKSSAIISLVVRC